MKNLLAIITLTTSVSTFAGSFDPLKDKFCKQENGAAEYTLILKNAVIGQPTGYTLNKFENSQTSQIKEQQFTNAKVVNKTQNPNQVITLYIGCDDGLFGQCFSGGFVIMRTLTQNTENTFLDLISFKTTEENGNLEFDFICEKVEKN